VTAPRREAIRFFVPGPVYVLDEIRREMTRPVAAHRSAGFRRVWASISAALPPVFRTARACMTATGSATFLMEASLVSLTRDAVLHLTNGAFSERWRDVGRSLGRAADEIAVPWGEAVDPSLVRAALRRRRYDAVTMVHSETSTGVLNPIADLAAAVREESDALVLVDTVSSLAAAPVETDAWGLDFVFAGTQKGLAAPPGLGVFTFSPRAEKRAESIPHRGYYGDLLRYRDQQAAGGPISTPAVAECYALERQLEIVAAEGLEARWARHARLAASAAAWATTMGIAFAAAAGHRSPSVSCLCAPPGFTGPQIVSRLAERGWQIGSGYGKWKQETFRIGHMGEVSEEDLSALLAESTEVLNELTRSARWTAS